MINTIKLSNIKKVSTPGKQVGGFESLKKVEVRRDYGRLMMVDVSQLT